MGKRWKTTKQLFEGPNGCISDWSLTLFTFLPSAAAAVSVSIGVSVASALSEAAAAASVKQATKRFNVKTIIGFRINHISPKHTIPEGHN